MKKTANVSKTSLQKKVRGSPGQNDGVEKLRDSPDRSEGEDQFSVACEGKLIYSEYFLLTKEYREKYGKNTVLLMQVGAFFEIYGLLEGSLDNTVNADKSSIYTDDSEILQISNICQLNIAEKKYIFKNKQLVMAGFRDHTLEKYLQRITENNFTAVVYVQEKNEKNTRRVFHSIHSAGTYISYEIDSYNSHTINNIMCIWLDVYRPHRKKPVIETDRLPTFEKNSIKENLICGISVANINTGKSFIFEYQTNFYMNPTSFDELERNISIYQPCEVIIISPFNDNIVQKIIQYSGIKTNNIHNFSSLRSGEAKNFPSRATENKTTVEKCSQQKYINHVLSTFYGEETYQLCSEFNTHIIATQSFCFLLNFIQEHNPNLVKNIKLPDFNNTTNRLILANHTLKQLNIIDDNMNDHVSKNSKMSSLVRFLNNCCSPMGKRLFQEQLLNPTFDDIWLEREYCITEIFLEKHSHLLEKLRKNLSQLKDIEKICRQIVIQKVLPSSIYHLYHSITIVRDTINLLYQDSDDSMSLLLQKISIPSIEQAHKTVGSPSLLHPCEIIQEKITSLMHVIDKTLVIENCKDVHSVNNFPANSFGRSPENGSSPSLRSGESEKNASESDENGIFEKNIIRKGISPLLDSYYEKQSKNIKTIMKLKDKLNEVIHEYLSETSSAANECRLEETLNYVKLHETEKLGYSFQITKKRSIILKTSLSRLSSPFLKINGVTTSSRESMNLSEEISDIQIPIKDIKITNATSSNDEIEIPLLNKLCRELQTLKDKINKEIQATYNDFIWKIAGRSPSENKNFSASPERSDGLSEEPLKIIENICEIAANIDVMQNKAYIAHKYNYCRPVIVNFPSLRSGEALNSSSSSSFVNAIGLRHPLIEHIQQNEIYVPNDLSIGLENPIVQSAVVESCKGILLYGVNTSGKTSLIRALGMSVIMAQSGIFVPCKKFIYKPYTAIYSRILGNDNLFKGLSTFAVEMSELRTIMKSADKNSLVVGDELCSGTELQSAISIFISGLMDLYEKKCSFIFATHLHEITNYDEIREMENVKIKHLSLHYDPKTECMVYDRILKDGPGSSNYGLTVCQSLYMPESFMQNAYNIRAKYFPETSSELSYKITKYNSQKIKGKCELCNINIADEIHHLREQNEANDDGFIDGFHKNHKANLAALCEKCHLSIHKKSNEQKVRKKTTKGYKITTLEER
jgi:DNA mismatch repair ATPase MutS